jgi:uncharacterized protein (DUF2141 family)
MKKAFLSLYFSALCAPLLAGNLVVKATGAKGKKMVHFILFSKSEGFPGEEQHSFYTDKVIAVNGHATWHISLPAGQPYAIAAYYDTNNNGRLDKNIFGAPTEPYGFSGNVRPLFRAPTFWEASFKFDNAGEVRIELK